MKNLRKTIKLKFQIFKKKFLKFSNKKLIKYLIFYNKRFSRKLKPFVVFIIKIKKLLLTINKVIILIEATVFILNSFNLLEAYIKIRNPLRCSLRG